MSMLQVCLKQSWPQNQPIAKVVFPQILPNHLGNLVTLWMMLPKLEIQQHQFSKPYRQFAFVESPHPMLLWVNALQATDGTSCWLPCYLDLKDRKNQGIVRLLAETGYYRLLLFSTEDPQHCAQVITVTLTPERCQQLRQWLQTSQDKESKAQPILSQRLLKAEFDQLKSQPLSNLEANALTFPVTGIR
jgi:serine/threonine-protein kinase